MGCPPLPRRHTLPLLTMIVVGPAKSGKSTLLSKLAPPRSEADIMDETDGKGSQDMVSFPLLKKFRILPFELRAHAAKTNAHYYPSGHLILIVIDYQQLAPSFNYAQHLSTLLHDVDSLSPDYCRLFVVLNKVDLLNEQNNQKKGEGEVQLMKMLGKLKHEVVTLKCAAEQNLGIDKLVENIGRCPTE